MSGCSLDTTFTISKAAFSKNDGLAKTGRPEASVGNPIDAGTGNKFQLEKDFVGPAHTGLELIRYYNSQALTESAFGLNWRSTWQRSINSASGSNTAQVIHADGSVDTYTLNASGNWQSDPDVTTTLSAVMNGATQTGWKLMTADDTTELYTLDGRLSAITNRAGLTTSLSYDANNRLSKVTGFFGQVLSFTYDANNHISTTTLPDGNIYTYTYDNNYNLTKVTYPDKSVRQYVYENTSFPNALTGIIDENGARFATFGYDALGRAISSEHAGGVEKSTITYNADGTSSVVDALGNAYSYGFTTQFAVVKPTAVSGTAVADTLDGKAFNYDANGFVASRTDWNGNVTTYTHDTRGNETSRTEASGTAQARTITTVWHPTFHLPTQVTEPSGVAGVNRITTLSYDATQGTLLSKTVAAGSVSRTWHYTYNPKGQLTSATDPNGNVTQLAYDATGGLAQTTNALGQSTAYSNDADSRPVKITDPNGLVTQIAYTPLGQIASRTVGQEVTTYSYDPATNPTQVAFPNGSRLAYTYNAAHQLTRTTDAFGNHIDYTLDLMGNRLSTQVSDASNNPIRKHSNQYDALGHLTQSIGSLGQTTSLQYDQNGNVVGVIDPLGNAEAKAYDPLNRLVRDTDPNGGKTVYTYDASNNLQQVTDPLGLNTQYTRDGLGEVLQLTSPDTGVTQKTYDAVGNVASSTDARGKVTKYTYDPLNRVVAIHRNDGGVISFTYDSEPNSIGHLVSMTDDTGTTHWSYDIHGRVVVKTQSYAGEQLSKIAYSYDPSTGNLAQMVYPSGYVMTYSYNQGQLQQVNVGGIPVVTHISYTPFGGIAAMQYLNGTTYTRSYDADGRVSQYTALGTRNIALGYDAASRITQYTDSAGVINQRMAYDKLGRITNANGYFGNETYSYDANGNRLSHTVPTETDNYIYDTTSNRLLSIAQNSGSTTNTVKRNYDAAGNTLSIGNQQFTYNDLGRMSTGGGATYFYNGLGQRIYKSSSNSYVTYDEAGHIIGEYNYHGPVVNETLYVGDIPVAIGTPTAAYFINTDHLNTPRVITDSNGNFQSFLPFTPFGDKPPITANNALAYNARFPGQFYDPETGLNNNGFRDYDPSTGRYVESDPIGLNGGINTYGYVGGNPVSEVDTIGLLNEASIENTKFTIETTGYGIDILNPPRCWFQQSFTGQPPLRSGLPSFIVPAIPQDVANRAYRLNKTVAGASKVKSSEKSPTANQEVRPCVTAKAALASLLFILLIGRPPRRGRRNVARTAVDADEKAVYELLTRCGGTCNVNYDGHLLNVFARKPVPAECFPR